jgi:hypothetical protein
MKVSILDQENGMLDEFVCGKSAPVGRHFSYQ